MAETTITFATPVPKDVYVSLRTQGILREGLIARTQQLLAIQFYTERRLSLGQAARLAGMDRWQFIELLSSHQVSVIDLNPEELDDEFAAVVALAAQLRGITPT